MDDKATKYAGWIAAGAVVMLAWTNHDKESGPTEPVPIGITVGKHLVQGDRVVLYKLWSDGVITVYTYDASSGCVNGGADCAWSVAHDGGLCLGDIDRNGEVGTSDLLGILSAWGDCPSGDESE